MLFLLPRWNKKIPAGLVVLFTAIGLSAALHLSDTYGVAVVGTIPKGLPTLVVPRVPFTAYLTMILPAMGVLLVAYSEALGVAHEFAEKHGYEVNADQELNAHAVVNVVSAFFGGMLAGGSMSASAVKEGAGARTQVTNLVAWIVTIVTLLFLTPLFAPLPEAVLAALIIHAVWHIIASRKLQRIRLESPVEFWFGVLALLGVLLIDVLEGMVIGLVASLIFVVYKSSRPHLSSLGRIPGIPGAYSDLTRHPENSPVPGVVILRLDAPIYYANALTVRDRAKVLIKQSQQPLRVVVLDATGQDELDITSADVLRGFIVDLKTKGIAIYIAELHAPVREFAKHVGLLDVIGEDHIFPTVETAVAYSERSNPLITHSDD
jgi:MFS superfamily sulfate permease-like transporter